MGHIYKDSTEEIGNRIQRTRLLAVHSLADHTLCLAARNAVLWVISLHSMEGPWAHSCAHKQYVLSEAVLMSGPEHWEKKKGNGLMGCGPAAGAHKQKSMD